MTLTGAQKLDRALAKVEADASDANVNRAAAALVGAASAPLSRSSRVRQTGKTKSARGRGWAIFGGPRAPFTAASHFGHRPRAQGGHMVANPFLFRGAEKAEDRVVDLFLTRTTKAIRDAGL